MCIRDRPLNRPRLEASRGREPARLRLRGCQRRCERRGDRWSDTPVPHATATAGVERSMEKRQRHLVADLHRVRKGAPGQVAARLRGAEERRARGRARQRASSADSARLCRSPFALSRESCAVGVKAVLPTRRRPIAWRCPRASLPLPASLSPASASPCATGSWGSSPATPPDSRGCSAARGSRGGSAPSARSARRSRPGCAVPAGRG